MNISNNSLHLLHSICSLTKTFVTDAAQLFTSAVVCMCPMQMHAADFISVDKLDSAIEAALDSRCVYNFAIDVKGNRYIEQPDGNIVISPPPSSEQHELTSGS